MSTPWFGGDRTFEQQMTGLDWLAEACRGKSILDFGCAEGLISIHLLKHGAQFADGVELLPERVLQAERLARKEKLHLRSKFIACNAESWVAHRTVPRDVTLALAILHKLRDPSTVARRQARATREMIVLRLPPATGSTIVDRRSGNVPHDIDAVLRSEGFVQKRAGNTGPLGEWIGVYRRG
mgnify:CR=1 FL=1